MKIKKLFYILIIMFCITFISCSELEIDSSTLELGDSIKLEIKIADPTWETLDESVATVNEEGIVKAVGYGETIIRATNGNVTREYKIVVTEKQSSNNIIVNGKQTISKDESISLNITISNYDGKVEYTYSSNDDSVVTVDVNGIIKGISQGIATINVTATFDGITLYKDVLIYVLDPNEEKTLVNIIQNIEYVMSGEVDLEGLSTNIENIVEEYKESIMGVTNYQYVRSGFNVTLEQAGYGTGFIFKKELQNDNTYLYHVLTNHHVIEDNVQVKLYFGYEDLEVDATVVESSSKYDLAVLTFTSAKEYKVLTFADNEDVSAGDFAIAIGNPKGYDYFGSVSFGIVSFNNRNVEGESSTFVQHDVAINPGNSGGPLINMKGEVIGVNTLKIVTDDVDNLGFSVDVNTIKGYIGKYL